MAIAHPRVTKALLSVIGMSITAAASATTTPASPPTLTRAACWGNYSVNPSNTTGDTDRANIQAALDKAAAIPGVVQLSAGTFYLASPLKMPSGVKLCTAGTAVLKWVGSSNASFAIENKPSAANIRISNLTFDGAGVSLNGAPSATIESNQFKNIQPIGMNSTQSVYGWFAVKLQDTTSILIQNNTFWKIAGSAIQGWRVTGTSAKPGRFENNWFGYVNQPIAMLDAQYATVKGNQGFEIERMGIEFSREEVPGKPLVDFAGIVVNNNQMANWRAFDTATCPDDVCKERYNAMGLSLVHLTGASATANVLDCGTGCLNATRGQGLEFDSVGTAKASSNVIRGFRDGISLHRGQDLTVTQNALFDVRNGVASTTQGSIDKLTISLNQIEAAPSRQIANAAWGVGIAPQWDHAGQVIIDNNAIAYATSSATSPAGGEYVGITVAQVRAGGTPGVISNNRIVIEGSPVSDFNVYGLRISGSAVSAGSPGSLQGTQITNNWVVAISKQGTGLDGGWQNNGTLGVTLQNNVFQNLAALNRPYAYHDTNGIYSNVSGNLAINMSAVAAPLPNDTSPYIATGKQVTLPTISVRASVEPPAINATGTTSLTFTSTVGATTPAFNQSIWYRGDGSVPTNVTSTAVTYVPGATRVVRDLVTNTDKALITNARVVTQK